jgi:hypothetical protein
MRFLFVNTDYPEFLRWFHAANPGLERRSYDEQARARAESLFAEADFYSRNLREIGHEAWDVRANNPFAQSAWAREQGAGIPRSALGRAVEKAQETLNRMPLAFLRPVLQPLLGVPGNHPAWFYKILAAQIRRYRPDVLYNFSMRTIHPDFLREMKRHARILIGQHAATDLGRLERFRIYDLAISSFPPTVAAFRAAGIRAELVRLAFEPRVLSVLKDEGRPFDAAFAGSFYDVHRSRTALIERLCERFEGMRVFGAGAERLPADSPIRKRYAGQAWGREMYQALRNAKIVFNHHGDVPACANNMRLYEATGVGALLVTDWKEDLREIFEPGEEVAAYRTPEECVEQIDYYLRHDAEREAIARRGQARTLRDHTYRARVQQIAQLAQSIL